MVQPSQLHVAPCIKGVEWGLGTKGLRMIDASLSDNECIFFDTGSTYNCDQITFIIPSSKTSNTRYLLSVDAIKNYWFQFQLSFLSYSRKKKDGEGGRRERERRIGGGGGERANDNARVCHS